MHLDLWTDGNLKPRPCAGIVIKRDGEVILSDGLVLEDGSTSNECEYSAVILGLYNCIQQGATSVTVRADSKLIVNHCSGRWQCRSSSLRLYLNEVHELVEHLERVEWIWIPRDQNEEVDAAARAACG